MSETVLLVEDSPDWQALIRKALGERYRLVIADRIQKAADLIEKQRFDLILLDAQLPDGDGFQFCAQLRSQARTRETPIVFLSVKGALMDKVSGMTLGADDYVVKPFEPLELLTRVKVRIARASTQASAGFEPIVRADLRLDLGSLRAYLTGKKGEAEIVLTPAEFKLLAHLARNEDRVQSREQLLSAVRGDDATATDRVIDRHVANLRRKLKPRSHYIQTVPGSGYLFSTAPKRD